MSSPPVPKQPARPMKLLTYVPDEAQHRNRALSGGEAVTPRVASAPRTPLRAQGAPGPSRMSARPQEPSRPTPQGAIASRGAAAATGQPLSGDHNHIHIQKHPSRRGSTQDVQIFRVTRLDSAYREKKPLSFLQERHKTETHSHCLLALKNLAPPLLGASFDRANAISATTSILWGQDLPSYLQSKCEDEHVNVKNLAAKVSSALVERITQADKAGGLVAGL